MGLGGFGRFFKKLGKNIGKGGLKVGKVVADVADIPMVKELVAMIPVAGPGIAFAMSRVDAAEKMFTGPKSGKQKREWAMTQLAKDLRGAGVEEKRILGMIELALLLNKNEAVLMDVVKGGSEKKPAAKKGGKGKDKPNADTTSSSSDGGDADAGGASE